MVPGHRRGEAALVRAAGLARQAGEAPSAPSADLEARLRAVLDEVTALDGELEARSAALADFSRAWERALGGDFGELSLAERLVLRLQRLEDGLLAEAARLAAGEPAPARRRRPARRTRRRDGAPRSRLDDTYGDDGGDGAPAPGAAQAGPAAPEGEAPALPPEVEAREVALKRLYRRLARVLHPDLARDEAERVRLSELMARVNGAYARGDLTELEVTAERVGAGEPLDALTEEERCAHLTARIQTLSRIAASLGRERDRLLRSDTERLRAEAARRSALGGDLVEETRAELAEELAAALADGVARLDRAAKAARALSRARKAAMKELERRGPTGARRAFDPLGESELVRQGASRLEQRRATAAARELARTLEDAVQAAPWEVALTCLAFFAESAGGRPPDALGDAAGWSAVWARLAPSWQGAPELARLLARPPRHLAVGARVQGGEVLAGLQLAAEELAAGVRIALERPSVAALGARALAALGPVLPCKSCSEEAAAVHLHRTRGLDTLHGLVCPRCGGVLRSYWRYGEVDGLEALAPFSLRLGLIAEVTTSLAGTALGFQLLPDEAQALTADRLRRRFVELYLTPYSVALPPAAVAVLSAGAPLAPAARVAGRPALELALTADAGMTGPALLELLRARIERRFRPE